MKKKPVIRVIAYAFVIPALLIFSCGDDDESPLLVEADFSVNDSTIMVGQEVTFEDNSTGEPTSWAWRFEGGDPSSSTARNPKVTYAAPGVYSVTLTASNGESSGTKEKEELITVFAEINADFTANKSLIEAGEEVTFTDSSTGDPTGWAWRFEGGSPSSSTTEAPKVIYNTPGVYSVTLTVSNGGGSNTEEKEEYITVVPEVNVDFSVNDSSIVAGGEVTFTDSSTGDPTSWEWRFEGGSPASSTLRNPKVIYNTPGVYSVTLAVSNGGSSDTEEKEEYITVVPEVNADFNVNESSIEVGEEVTFTDSSTGDPTSWEWRFEGGSPASSTLRNPKVIYNTPGVYSVTLAASKVGSSDTEEKERLIKVDAAGNIAHYLFDGDGSDIGGLGFDGVLEGVNPTTDRQGTEGKALAFDGVDDYIAVSDTLDNTISGEVTLAVWVYLTGSDKTMAIISNFNGRGSSGACVPAGRVGFNLAILPDGGLRMTYATFNDNFQGRRSPANSLAPGTWYHVAGTWDGTTRSNEGFKLYINGVRSDNTNFSEDLGSVCPAFVESASPLHFGRSTCLDGACQYFEGKMDNLRIYNRVLTESEIQAIMQLD